GLEEPVVETGVPEAGPEGDAPADRPWEAGIRYVVAAIDALICGKPFGPAPRLIAFRVMSRPLTATPLLLAITKRSTRPRKSARWKKFPWKVKVNGSTGNPAGPTEAPGGSAALAACVAAVGVVGTALALPGVSVRSRKSTCDLSAAACSW